MKEENNIISGTITGPNGEAVANMAVDIIDDATGSPIVTVISDADGNYSAFVPANMVGIVKLKGTEK